MEIDEWMQKNGKTRNKWGNWTNTDVREYKSWLESQPKETEKKNDVDLDTNKDGKVGLLEKLAGKSKIAAAINKAVDSAEKQQTENANKANFSFSSPEFKQAVFVPNTVSETVRKAAEDFIMGKTDSLQGEKEEKPEEKKDITLKITPEKKEEVEKKIEQAERDKEIDDKSSTFLKSWASTHPTWLKILSSKDLSWGQKVALVGSALANIGANVTLGAKAGFEHGSFAGVPWDFKQAVDKYTNQEIETVLGEGEQKAKAKAAAAEFWNNYQKENGKEATDELMALVDLYGDNPDVLSSRLRAMGINKSADEVKDLYANLDKTTLSESAKQKKLETETKEFENAILRLTADEKLKTNEKVIAAKNALNDLQTTSATFDEKTYKLRKIGGMLKDVIETVEGAASTVGGVLTGGVVGKVKDGIIRAPRIPQKIVRADGTEIQLDPNDNVYATKNELTTEKDDGSDIVHMTQSDEAVTVQKKLGYCGGVINKDFDYYLSKLRG